MIPLPAIGFLSFTIWALFQPDRKIKRNPSPQPTEDSFGGSSFAKKKNPFSFDENLAELDFATNNGAALFTSFVMYKSNATRINFAEALNLFFNKKINLSSGYFYPMINTLIEKGIIEKTGTMKSAIYFVPENKRSKAEKYIDKYLASSDVIKDFILFLKKKKNPSAGKCVYEMNVSYRRGKGPVQKRSLLAEAYTQTEARNTFQNLINKNLKDASLESLSVRRRSC